MSIAVFERIGAFRQLRGGYGNIDDGCMHRGWASADCFRCEYVLVLMTHIGGYPGRYEPRFLSLIDKFHPNLVVTGHSHILKVMYDRKHGALHINPGAAGKYGFHKVRTAVRLEVDGHDMRNLEVGEWIK